MRIKPKKRLGQNFLKDKNILRRIADSCDLHRCDLVLEIGAGSGELTGLLAEKAAVVLAVEIDPELIPGLSLGLQENGNVRVIQADILKLDVPQALAEAGGESPVKVIGNIPYYISSAVIEKLLLDCRGSLADIYLTVQLEFGQRLCACPGSKSYGPLSLFAQYYSRPELLFKIKSSCFYPVPKVDSCLVRLKPREETPLSGQDEILFFRLVRAAFQQRRKMLRNTLKHLINADLLSVFLRDNGLPLEARGEVLSPGHFISLVGTAKKNKKLC